MTIHHIVTIILIGTSYITAQYRIGSVIIVVHDCSDYWLEVGNYTCIQKVISFFSYKTAKLTILINPSVSEQFLTI